MANTISNMDDIIDSRDVIERIEELEELRDAAETEAENQNEALSELEAELAAEDADNAEVIERINERIEDHGPRQEKIWSHDGKREFYASADYGQDEEEELHQFQEFASEGNDEWKHGETLVRESHFENYAQELAEELDLIKPEAQWPYTCIDWEHAARELKYDYTGADFDGITYFYRS